MSKTTDIDEMVNRFRLASREMFNHYFRDLDLNGGDQWALAERFSAVQDVLFQKLVAEPASLSNVSYGEPQPGIFVALRSGIESAPALINRETKSGYWDHPVRELARGSKLLFIGFFDWNQLDYRDNQYVRVQIEDLPSHPETRGKHALIEWRHVTFVEAKRDGA